MAKKKQRKRATPPPTPVRNKPPRTPAAAEPTKRQQQRNAQQAAQRRDALRRRLVAAGLALAAVAAVALYVVLDRRSDAELRAVLTAGSCTVDSRADPTGPAGRNHVQNPSYGVDPPSAGDHLPSVARAGVYAGTSVPADGLLVHALEHGYVIAWHQPDLPAEQLAQLEAFQAQHADDVIVAERPGLPVPFAVTAWNQRLLCQEVEATPLRRFFDERVGNGPEDVPRG